MNTRKQRFFADAKNVRLPVLDLGGKRPAAWKRTEDASPTPLLAAIVAIENGITATLARRTAKIIRVCSCSSAANGSPT